jgi:hypothetical protein
VLRRRERLHVLPIPEMTVIAENAFLNDEAVRIAGERKNQFS